LIADPTLGLKKPFFDAAPSRTLSYSKPVFAYILSLLSSTSIGIGGAGRTRSWDLVVAVEGRDGRVECGRGAYFREHEPA